MELQEFKVRFDSHHAFEFERSEDKVAPWAVKSKTGWALSSPLSAKQAAALSITAISISDNKFSKQLSKWCVIESYASSCVVTVHSKYEERSIKTLGQTMRFNSERYEVRLLWREDEVNLPNNYYSGMGQLKSLERRLQKDKTLWKRFIRKPLTQMSKQDMFAKLTKMNWIKPKTNCNGICHIFLTSTHNPEKVRGVCNAAAR